MHDAILVPTDGSDGSEAAVEQAVDLAKRYDATVHVLYVVEAPNVADAVDELDGTGVFDRLEDAGEQAVAEVVDQVTAAGVEDVESAVEDGTPYEEIVDYVERSDVDMVVMATKGRTGDAREVLGSVTEKVIRFSPVPVVSVNVGEQT